MGAAEPDTTLEVKIQAAVIQVDGAHHTQFVVTDQGLAVDKPRQIFVHLHPRFHQRLIVGASQLEHPSLVRNMRGDDAHIHPRLGGGTERLVHGVVDDKVRSGQVEIAVGSADEVDKHSGAHFLIVQGTVHEGLHQAICWHRIRQVDVGAVLLEVLHLQLVHVPSG